jgi:hypothetical protein
MNLDTVRSDQTSVMTIMTARERFGCPHPGVQRRVIEEGRTVSFRCVLRGVGRAIVQAVSRRLPTAAAQVRAQVR